MNRQVSTARGWMATGLVIALVAGGCATAGYQRAAQTRATVARAQDLVAGADARLAALLADLDQIQDPQNPDLRPAFRRYGRRVDDLRLDRSAIGRRGERLQDKADAYFRVWNQELDGFAGARARETSSQRRRTAEASVRRIEQQFAAVDQSFGAVLPRLGDLKRLLANDLTAAGVGAAREWADQVRGEVGQLRQQLQGLQTALERIDAELAPSQALPQMQPGAP